MPAMVHFIAVPDGVEAHALPEAVRKLFKASKAERILARNDLLAIKVHVGEKGNVTHVPPEPVAEIVRLAKKAGALPFLTETSTLLQKSMAEYAMGCVKGKEGKAFYFNFLIHMTRDCDCLGTKQKKLIPDLGILASNDPVAIDKATLDLTEKAHGRHLGGLSYSHLNPMVQLIHWESIGLGSLEYELMRVG